MMKRIAIISVILALLLSAGTAMAAIKGSADVVTVGAVEKSISGEAGERVAFAIAMDIADTWHVYAHGDTNFIGVDVVLGDEFPLAEFEAEYPAGHEGEFFGEAVWMIGGSSKISATALIPDGMESGDYEISVGVKVQACDDKTCLAPIDLPVMIKLTVN